jgi:hypothetical protein
MDRVILSGLLSAVQCLSRRLYIYLFSVQEDFSVSFRFCHSLCLGNTPCCREFVGKGKTDSQSLEE